MDDKELKNYIDNGYVFIIKGYEELFVFDEPTNATLFLCELFEAFPKVEVGVAVGYEE